MPRVLAGGPATALEGGELSCAELLQVFFGRANGNWSIDGSPARMMMLQSRGDVGGIIQSLGPPGS